MKVSVLLPYWNPHLVPIFNELEKLGGYTIDYGISSEMSNFRKGYRFTDPKDKDNIYRLYLKAEKKLFDKHFKTSHVCISHGVFYKFIIPYAIEAKKESKPFFIMSESDNTVRSNALKRLFKRILVSYLNTNNFSLLTLGGRKSYLDYLQWGASNWNAFRFGFAPYPLSQSTNGHHQDRAKKILYVGQLIPRKNVEMLIKALPEIVNQHPQATLLIAGDGESKETITTLVDELELKNNVRILGQINDPKELGILYDSADILVLPSIFEGWGAVVNEAMYHGLPIALSAGVMCQEELLHQGRNGYLFNSIDQLINAVNKVFALTDHEYLRFQKESKKIVNNWTPEKMALKLVALFEFICNKSSKLDNHNIEVFHLNSPN